MRNYLLLAMMLGWGKAWPRHNPPDADDKVISPSQSEEVKQLMIKAAEEKRARKKLKRKFEQSVRDTYV